MSDEDPQSGHLFVFFNRRRDRMKSLMRDGSGYFASHLTPPELALAISSP